MVFQKAAKRFGGVLIPADGGLRLRYQQLDGGLASVRLGKGQLRFLERLVELFLMIKSFGQRVVRIPTVGLKLRCLLQGGYGQVVAAFINEGHAKGGKCARVLRVNLRGFFEGGLRFFRPIAAEKNHALKIEHVRMIGCESGGFVEKFLSLIEFVVAKGLQGFVHGFLRLRSKDRSSCHAQRFGSRVALKNDIFLGLDSDRNRDFFLRRAVADRISSYGVVTQPVEDKDDSTLRGRPLLGEHADIVKLHGDQRSYELAGAVLDRYRNLGAITADAALV